MGGWGSLYSRFNRNNATKLLLPRWVVPSRRIESTGCFVPNPGERTPEEFRRVFVQRKRRRRRRCRWSHSHSSLIPLQTIAIPESGLQLVSDVAVA